MHDLADSNPIAVRPEHAGSASPQLSGFGVLFSWICSVAFHVLLLGVMYLLVFPYTARREEIEHPVTFTQIIGEVDATGTIPAPPGESDALDAAMTEQPALQSPNQRLVPRISPGDSLSSGLPGLSAITEREVGGGLGGSSFPGMPVIGLGSGIAGSGTDAGHPGVSLGGGGNVSFFGLKSAAPGVRSIVYVVDRSYSMVGIMDAVKAELRRSINALRRSQKFHVVFYNSGVPLQNPPERLVPAIATHKGAFSDFLETVDPIGGSEPLNALRLALAVQPDVVYFFSDGEFEAKVAEELLERLRIWNEGRRTRIYTLGYNELSYMEPRHRKTLWTIAREHGGEYRFVSDELP